MSRGQSAFAYRQQAANRCARNIMFDAGRKLARIEKKRFPALASSPGGSRFQLAAQFLVWAFHFLERSPA